MIVYLEVALNGMGTGTVAEFMDRGGGHLAIKRTELKALGITPGAAADDPINLDDVPGLTYRYDATKQVVSITADPALLPHHLIDASDQVAMPTTGGGRGVVLNYTLFGDTGAANAPSGAASLDGRLFSKNGLLLQSGLLHASANGFDVTRLDTAFVHSSPDSLVTWMAGDAISGGLSWTRPYRFGGFKIERNFGLRPDLVTMPLPSFNGSAAVPSAVDVYAGGTRIYSGSVAAGPFTLANLPVVTGAGTAQIVVKDALGRETTTDVPFFASSSLLKRGLLDFSAEAGFPRLSYGVRSADYVPTAALSGTLRYGLTDTVTLEAHGEASAGVWNGGAGVVMPAGRLGMMSAAIAASVGDHAGIAVNGSIDLNFGKAAFRLHALQTFADYADVAYARGRPSPARPRHARSTRQVFRCRPFPEPPLSASLAWFRMPPRTSSAFPTAADLATAHSRSPAFTHSGPRTTAEFLSG